MAPSNTVNLPIKLEPAEQPQTWFFAAPIVYASVTLLLLSRLIYSLITLRLIAARSAIIRDYGFRELAHELWLKSESFIRPRIVISRDISSPVTFDADDTWILLPQNWRTWKDDKLRAVLAHELAHVKRGDSQTLFLASLATCLFWFNPLAWFLQRQLASLAEEACDEFVIHGEATPERYANLLIEFVRELQEGEGRLVGAIAVAGTSAIQRRIERLFMDDSKLRQGKTALAVVALLLFLPALYLTAAARSADTQEQPKAAAVFNWERIATMTPEDAARLESTPEDLDAQVKLTSYYQLKREEEPYTQHLLWIIQNHPDSEDLTAVEYGFRRGQMLSAENHAKILAAFEDAMAAHPTNPVIEYNAVRFIIGTDALRALDMLHALESSDPSNRDKYKQDIGTIYIAAELNDIAPSSQINNVLISNENGTLLRSQLESSRDANLLANTGRMLIELNRPSHNNPVQFNRGIELIQQAIAVDPGNKEWADQLQEAKDAPARQANEESMNQAGIPQPGTVRIDGKLTQADLISKTDPVYPPLALQARISGTVKFIATVGTDGKVEKLQLVSGHPLMVKAAKDAVLNYVYHPATVDGKPVPFETEVIVPFKLPDTQ
jgi:beta-lactamase regulating signal transducer with metallopeptidase domain